MTRFWCFGAEDQETLEYFYFGVDMPPGSGHTLEDGAAFLSEARILVAHNGLDHDYRALDEFTGGIFKRPAKCWDTLVVAKLLWPADILIGPDWKRVQAGLMPAQMMKRHSLAAWGYRTGEHKDDYKGGFAAFHPDMPPYMAQDAKANGVLWRLCKKRMGWTDPVPGALVWPEFTLEYEHDVARIILAQEEDGVAFNMAKARKLEAHLKNLLGGLEHILAETFGSWWQPLDDPEMGRVQGSTIRSKLPGFPDVTVPRVGKKGQPLAPYVGPPLEEITEGSVWVRIDRVTFQPSSRDHLGQRLQAQYGWKPKGYGKNGKPTVDDSVLREIPESVMPAAVRQALQDFFVVSRTLGSLSKGVGSWINCANRSDDGRIHGHMDTCGAITRRGTHSKPNLSGTPAVEVDKASGKPVMGLAGKFGYECKELYEADEGWELTDCDAASLELIDLGHYLFPLDGGVFSARVCDPNRDPHQEHADLAALQRRDAKTAIYLFVYGGSAYKLSLDPALLVTIEEIPGLLGYKGLPSLLSSLRRRFADAYVEPDDVGKAKLVKARKIILSFEKNIEGLKDLMDLVKASAEKGWLKAMDGSLIHIRKAHAALNSLLQSAGAITCKVWMARVHKRLNAMGLHRGRDFKQVLWVHDALTFTHRPGLGPLIKKVCQDEIRETGILLGLRGEYRASGNTGRHWAECH